MYNILFCTRDHVKYPFGCSRLHDYRKCFLLFCKVKIVIYHLKLRSKFVHALIVEYMVIVWLNLSVGFVDGI